VCVCVLFSPPEIKSTFFSDETGDLDTIQTGLSAAYVGGESLQDFYLVHIRALISISNEYRPMHLYITKSSLH
jgi:hypothetical protein